MVLRLAQKRAKSSAKLRFRLHTVIAHNFTLHLLDRDNHHPSVSSRVNRKLLHLGKGGNYDILCAMTANMLRESADAPSQPPGPQATSTTLATTGSNIPHNPRTTGASRTVETQVPHSDGISDKATAAFIRRTLCSHNVLLGNGERGHTTPQQIEEVLPPLTSSNEVDLQLYGIIAVIIKEFVQTWYSKVTPDHVFVNEILQIIAHCTRALEQRLREIDLESVLLDEIPELLEVHLRSFRLAKQQAESAHSLTSDPRLIYHMLQPHPALHPVPTDTVPLTIVEQRESESAWRQLLVQGALAVLLPTEDLENGCLRALVAEIFAEMILGNGISGKACEGWLLWEGITSIAKVLQNDDAKETELQPRGANAGPNMTRLERFGLLSSALDEQQTPSLQHVHSKSHQTTLASILGLFWTVVQFAFLAATAARAVILKIATSSSLPPRSGLGEPLPIQGSHQPRPLISDAPSSTRPTGTKRPIVSMKLWSCVSQILELDLRMPWLSGFVSMLHCGLLAGPGKVGDTDGILDRFLSHTVHSRILNPAFLPIILRTLRATLFPNNALGPARQPPSAEEAREIKRRCAASLLNLCPRNLACTFFATQEGDRQLDMMEEVLGCLDDAYLNKHAMFQIVELIVVRLVPELGERGIGELIEERVG